LPFSRAFFLPLPHLPPPLPVPLPLPFTVLVTAAGGGRSGVDVVLLSALPLARGISSPLLVWLVLARFLLCGLVMPLPADVGASPRCLVYWLLPRRLTLRPAPFLCDSFSCAGGGGLSGCEEGGGDACEVVLALGVSSGSPSAMELAYRSRLTLLSSKTHHLVFFVRPSLVGDWRLQYALFHVRYPFRAAHIVLQS
jgi:hypothetical protein